MISKFLNHANRRKAQQRAEAMNLLKYCAPIVDGELSQKLHELSDTMAENDEAEELIIMQNKSACRSVTIFIKIIAENKNQE
jgi:hypothetical protein